MGSYRPVKPNGHGILRRARKLPNPDYWASATDRGMQVPQELLLSLNAVLILILVVPVSWVVRKMRTLSCMLVGMAVATGGILVGGLTSSGWVLTVGILFFSLGEMLTGPKKNIHREVDWGVPQGKEVW